MRYLLPTLLVAVPLISYVVWYRMAVETARRREDGTLPRWRDAPWGWITVATVGLMALALVGFGLTVTDPDGSYVPARLEDGEVIPGYVDE